MKNEYCLLGFKKYTALLPSIGGRRGHDFNAGAEFSAAINWVSIYFEFLL